jgi:hypothetical protein
MPSGPQFNGLVYHNPVNPDEIVCDLCESWTVSPDGKTYTFRLRQAHRPPFSASSKAAKTVGGSKRGKDIKSMEPSMPTSAIV